MASLILKMTQLTSLLLALVSLSFCTAQLPESTDKFPHLLIIETLAKAEDLAR